MIETERLAIIETKLTYISTAIDRVEETVDRIQNNHLAHLQAEIQSLHAEMDYVKNHCKTEARQRLSGKEKAVLYGTFLTVLGTVTVEIIRTLLA